MLPVIDCGHQFGPTVVYDDNQGAVALSKNPVNRQRSKHIDVRYHFIRIEVNSENTLKFNNNNNNNNNINICICFYFNAFLLPFSVLTPCCCTTVVPLRTTRTTGSFSTSNLFVPPTFGKGSPWSPASALDDEVVVQLQE